MSKIFEMFMSKIFDGHLRLYISVLLISLGTQAATIGNNTFLMFILFFLGSLLLRSGMDKIKQEFREEKKETE